MLFNPELLLVYIYLLYHLSVLVWFGLVFFFFFFFFCLYIYIYIYNGGLSHFIGSFPTVRYCRANYMKD
jgi:hypothetical protein